MTDREREFWVLFLYEEEVGAEVIVVLGSDLYEAGVVVVFFNRFGNVRPKLKVSNYGFVCCVLFS